MSNEYVVLERGLIGLRGDDARALLQGVISTKIERVSPQAASYGALLTPQGKYLFDFMIVQIGDLLLLDTEATRVTDLLRRLMMYRLRAKVEIEDLGGSFLVAAMPGEGAAPSLGLPDHAGAARSVDGGVLFIDPRVAELGGRAVLPRESAARTLEDLGFAAAPGEVYDRRRLELGVPDGSRDLVIERSTLLESGFEELHGVDFDKGCFVGQELTARMKYRGLVRKRLMPVDLKGPPPAPQTRILLDGKEAGEMRSSEGEYGIALLRLEHVAKAAESGTPLLADSTEVIPHKPDWANF
ncbi:MAG: folate-binding protein [Pseudomonadota bacterium]